MSLGSSCRWLGRSQGQLGALYYTVELQVKALLDDAVTNPLSLVIVTGLQVVDAQTTEQRANGPVFCLLRLIAVPV